MFGNYLVSRLLVLPQMHYHFEAAVRGHVVSLMRHPQGSRVVQSALRALPREISTGLISEM